MNQPTDHSVPTPGHRLREARLQQNWTLKQAARRLRLPSSIVSDLENDNHANLASIYVRGYLLNYARLLGIDDESFRAALAEHGGDTPPLRQAVPVKREMLWLEKALRGATYVVVTAGIIVPLVWWFTQGAVQLSSIESGSRMDGGREIAATPAGSSTTARDGGETLRVQPRREARQAPHVSASVTPLPRFSTGSEPSGDNALPGAPLAPPAGDASLWSMGVLGEPGVGADGAGSSRDRIQLWLNADSWVEITDSSGRRLEYGLLGEGEVRSYRGQSPLRVLIGRSSAVDLHYNGNEIDLSRHTRGNVASFNLGQPQPQADG